MPKLQRLPKEARAIGDAMRAWRDAANLTQEQAAPLLGTTLRSVLRWEGGYSMPPTDKFLRAVRVYGATKELIVFLAKWEKATRSAAGGSAAGEGNRRAG